MENSEITSIAALLSRIESTNNGYARREYLTKAEISMVDEAVERGLLVATDTTIFTPFGYECACKGHG